MLIIPNFLQFNSTQVISIEKIVDNGDHMMVHSPSTSGARDGNEIPTSQPCPSNFNHDISEYRNSSLSSFLT